MATIIDARGKNCPIPVLMAKKEIDGGQQAFAVDVDNAIAVQNLQKLAQSQGYACSVTPMGNDFRVSFIQSCEACEAILEQAAPAPASSGGQTAVFVPRKIIGAGSEELGTNLMRMFFYTIAQGDALPASIVFMNEGVYLPVLDAQVVEHLRALQEKGVEILVCGTCLNYYGLTEKLQIGTVSNMYDITQALQLAQKVITL